MKICFLYHSVFKLGGVQRVLSNILNNLSEEYEIDLIITENFNLDNNVYNLNLNKVNIKQYNFDYFSSNEYKRRKKLIRQISRLNKIMQAEFLNKRCIDFYYNKKFKSDFCNFINEQNYDYIIGCSMFYNLILGNIKKELQCKVIGWEHLSFDSHFDFNGTLHNQEAICKIILSNLDEIVVLSNVDKRKYQEIMNLNPIVIPNPTTFSNCDFSEVKNKYFLYTGRLEYNKGIDLLLESFKIFNETDKEWKLIIVGEGTMKEYIFQFINRYQLQNYIILHEFTSQVKEFYLKSSIYLCCSRYESFGLSVLEAMQCGVPVISFDTSGPSELIDNNVEGFLVNKYNIDLMAEMMLKLSKNYELRKILSFNCIKKSQSYKIDTILRQWIDIFE